MDRGSRPDRTASRSRVLRPSLICSGLDPDGIQPSPHSKVLLNTFLAVPPRRIGGWGFWKGLGKDLTGGKS